MTEKSISSSNAQHYAGVRFPSLRGRWIEYRSVWLGLRWGAFTCVEWQVTLCDPIWQVTLWDGLPLGSKSLDNLYFLLSIIVRYFCVTNEYSVFFRSWYMQVDASDGFRTRSILCMPIRDANRHVIGVAQLVNKHDGTPFNKNDENLFEVCSWKIYLFLVVRAPTGPTL